MRRRSLLAVAGLALVLAGCSGEEEAPERPATERLAAAKANFDAANTVALDLSSLDVPPRENGVTAAKGSGVISATEPKFAGEWKTQGFSRRKHYPHSSPAQMCSCFQDVTTVGVWW